MDNVPQNEQKENIVKVADTTISMVSKRKIEETMVCAKNNLNDEASCEGDSGKWILLII